MVHWPVAFPPGNGLEPPHPTIQGELAIDKETSLVDTWKKVITLPKSKVKLGLSVKCQTLIRIAQVRAVGVSNLTIDKLQGIIDATGVVPVSFLPSQA